MKEQQGWIVQLDVDLEDKNHQLTSLEEASPIKVFGKVQDGQRGATLWPLYVWELILEQLMNGRLPTSVNANMFLQRFSPKTKMKDYQVFAPSAEVPLFF